MNVTTQRAMTKKITGKVCTLQGRRQELVGGGFRRLLRMRAHAHKSNNALRP